MCGIAGIFTQPGERIEKTLLSGMVERLRHRGPDASAEFHDAEAGIHLGHARLSVVDLSPTGAQPMASHSGRYKVTLNGEIYNYREMRADLEREHAISWRGSSDTEVLLTALEVWGLEVMLTRCDGMFAMAVWDAGEKALYLARDRFGEKPLYFGHSQGRLYFASELAAMIHSPGFEVSENTDAIDMMLALSYIPEPYSPFANIHKLPPGSYVRLDKPTEEVKPKRYWDAFLIALNAQASQRANGRDIVEIRLAIEERLKRAIGNQMVADVPLGAFLSGGIDSSLVVALMQEQAARPIKTFTIGFEEKGYNEAPEARAIADHLGTEHTEVILTWQDALDVVERLPDIYSEPFADSSQLPTHLVSSVARQDVTVALSGDAGDEVFGGYNRHVQAMRYDAYSKFLPPPVARPLGRLLKAASQPRRAHLIERFSRLTGGQRVASEKLSKIAAALSSTNGLDLYLDLVRRDGGMFDVPALREHFSEVMNRADVSGLSRAEFMMLMDTVTYLPGDILHKVDRAAMAVSLETRAPYLDHKLFELSWSLPIGERIKNGKSKSVLRDMLAERVPPSLFERPKAGFGVPIESWLKGPLKSWMQDHVADFARDFPDRGQVLTSTFQEFLAGKGHHHHLLWNVAMLQAWRARHLGR